MIKRPESEAYREKKRNQSSCGHKTEVMLLLMLSSAMPEGFFYEDEMQLPVKTRWTTSRLV